MQSTPELILTCGATAKSAKQRAALSAATVKVQHRENKGKAVPDSAQHDSLIKNVWPLLRNNMAMLVAPKEALDDINTFIRTSSKKIILISLPG